MQFRAEIGDRNIRTMYRCHSQFPHRRHVHIRRDRSEAHGIISVKSIFDDKLLKKIQIIVVGSLQRNIK